MIKIPIFSESSADFTQTIELNNILFTIRLKYNIRCGYWFINIETENNTTGDFKVVYDYPIFKNHKSLFYDIKGDFIVKKVNDTDNNLSYSNLGNDFILYYYTENEINEWLDENNIKE